MKPWVVASASRMDWTSVVTHVDGAYSRSSHASVASTTVYCGQSRPWQNLRRVAVLFRGGIDCHSIKGRLDTRNGIKARCGATAKGWTCQITRRFFQNGAHARCHEEGLYMPKAGAKHSRAGMQSDTTQVWGHVAYRATVQVRRCADSRQAQLPQRVGFQQVPMWARCEVSHQGASATGSDVAGRSRSAAAGPAMTSRSARHAAVRIIEY